MKRRDFLLTAAGTTTSLSSMAICGAGDHKGITLDSSARELAQHRISRMVSQKIRDRYPRQVGRNAKGGGGGSGGSYRVRAITTDQGVTGWGMSYIEDEKVAQFIGAKVGDLYDIQEGVTEDAFLLDIPMHDLVGNILAVPVWKLMGAKGPQCVPIYSGAVYFDDLEPQDRPRGIEGVLASCRQDYETGYRAFKLKIGRGFKIMPRNEGDRRDIEVTRAVRETFPDCRILVDANDGYTCDSFMKYVTAVADCDLYFIEEPFTENRNDLRRLKEHMDRVGCKAMIAEGESRTAQSKEPWAYGGYTHEHIERLYALAEEKLVDVFVIDLGIVGYTRWRQIMHELEAAGVQASPHTWAWTPRPFYAAQLAGGVGNVCIVEGIPGAAEEIDYSAYRFQHGNLVLPEAAGFGLGFRG